jgi:hypothetical protein
MDIKRLMTSMLFAAALMMVVFYGPKACSSSPAAQHSFHAPANAARWEGDQSVPPKTVQLGDFSKPATDRLVITINPFTAAIDRVEVNPRYFAATYKRTDPLVLMESVPGLAKPFATTEVRLNSIAYPFMGKAANVDALWHIARKTDTELDLQKDFVGLDNKPLAVITKTFRIDPATYEVIITHTVRNVRVPQVVQRAASDKVIELGAKDVFNVVVKVGETLKEAGRDYTVKGPEGQVSIVDGTIKPTDTVNISFNLPGDKLTAAIDQLGPGELHRDDAQADDRFYHSIHMVSGKNYIDADKGFDLPHPTLSKATTGGTAIVGGPNGQFSDFSKNPQLWIASSNRFFTAVARPLPEIVTHDGAVVIPAGTAPAAAKSVRPPGAAVQLLASGYGEGHFIDMPTHISSANIDLMKTHGPGGNPLKPEEIVSIVRFTGNTLEVPPGTTVSEPLTVYMGPKDRRVFEGDLSAPEGSEPYNFAVYRYIKLIQFQQGCYSYCISLYVAARLSQGHHRVRQLRHCHHDPGGDRAGAAASADPRQPGEHGQDGQADARCAAQGRGDEEEVRRRQEAAERRDDAHLQGKQDQPGGRGDGMPADADPDADLGGALFRAAQRHRSAPRFVCSRVDQRSGRPGPGAAARHSRHRASAVSSAAGGGHLRLEPAAASADGGVLYPDEGIDGLAAEACG